MTRIATRAARNYVQVAFETPAAMVDDAAAILVAKERSDARSAATIVARIVTRRWNSRHISSG